MDKRKIKNYQIFSIIFTFILGSLLHFTYKLSGENQFISIFSSISESIWEHLKLVYFPMLFSIIIGKFYFKGKIDNFICSKAIGIISSMLFMITFFYTYTGILGYNISIVDITLFFVSAILGESISYFLIINEFKCNKIVSIIVLTVIFIFFLVFTFKSPNVGIFKNPVN